MTAVHRTISYVHGYCPRWSHSSWALTWGIRIYVDCAHLESSSYIHFPRLPLNNFSVIFFPRSCSSTQLRHWLSPKLTLQPFLSKKKMNNQVHQPKLFPHHYTSEMSQKLPIYGGTIVRWHSRSMKTIQATWNPPFASLWELLIRTQVQARERKQCTRNEDHRYLDSFFMELICAFKVVRGWVRMTPIGS